MYKDMIKQLAMKKMASEKEQIVPFRAGNIKMQDLHMFSTSINNVFGIYKGAKFVKNFLPTPAKFNDYQAVVFSTRTPQFTDDISQFGDKQFLYGMKDHDLMEPFYFDSEDQKRKYNLEEVPDEVPCRFTGGWFKDEKTGEFKLLILLPNPKIIFNRLVKVENPDYDPMAKPPTPQFLLKSVNDAYTKYSYDFPLKFAQNLFETVFMEYALLYADKFIVDNIKLSKDAGGAKFTKRKSGVTIKDIVEAYQNAPQVMAASGNMVDDPVHGPHRPVFVARRMRDAVDLFTPKDEPPPNRNPNVAWKANVLRHKPGAAPKVEKPVDKKPDALDILNMGPAPKEDKEPKKPTGPGLDLAAMNTYRIYKAAEINKSTRMENGTQVLLEEGDSRSLNSWTMNDYVAPAVKWDAGDQRQPTKSASFGASFKFPKSFALEGTDDMGHAPALEINFSFDRMENVDNSFEAYIQIKDYIKTVDNGRITGEEMSAGKEQREAYEHKRAEASLAKINAKKIQDMNNEADELVATNIKYRNELYSKNRPTIAASKGILDFMTQMDIYINRLRAQTPRSLDVIEDTLESPDGIKKIKKGDINLLRIIFD